MAFRGLAFPPGIRYLHPMDMLELLKVADDQRGPDWEAAFLRALPTAYCAPISPDPQVGPDGWPYLLVEISEKSDRETVDRILQWLAPRGIGLVVNPQKDFPDFVLSYGMIWNHLATGYFVKPAEPGTISPPAGGIPTTQPTHVIDSPRTVLGEPTKESLPDHVRKILREFLRDQGVLKPRILGVSPDGKDFELAFSLESLGNPPSNEHAGVAEAIAWFLPPHYPILLMEEKGRTGFVDL